jgi:hypothetical protein
VDAVESSDDDVQWNQRVELAVVHRNNEDDAELKEEELVVILY